MIVELSFYRPDFRNYVLGLDIKVPIAGGRFVKAVNLDNAATTPPFKTVIKEINSFAPWYSSVHRGTGYKSLVSTKVLEKCRLNVLDFFNADKESFTAIYVKNTTEAINKLSYRLCSGYKKCVILSTDMEHHSNDLPWRDKFIVDYVAVDRNGRLSLNDLELKLIKYRGIVKLVTIAGASNVTGYVNPVYHIADLAHKYGAMILVDGAQLAPHRPIDMRPANKGQQIDFLAFSAHKMYAPFGIGVLVGSKEIFKMGAPDYAGGGTVKIVTHSSIIWDDPPEKEEAGSPNLMGIVALDASIKTMSMLGMKEIEAHEMSLMEYALKRLKGIHDLQIYGDDRDGQERVGIIPFNIKGVHHRIAAAVLSCEFGIAVRNGCFCAQPYVQKLLDLDQYEIEKYLKNPDDISRPGMVRVSFGLYNDYHEIDLLADAIKIICGNKEYYIEKYGQC